MPSVTQREPAEFFVVGGPVQPERPCYVEREADRRLDEALRAKRLCCVLGARAIGKSSLLLRAARALRASGTLVATVDLRPLPSSMRTTARTHGSAASRSVWRPSSSSASTLRVWWSAHDTVGENRLVEFFWEVVLTNTTAPVVVLLDEVDAALELPFAAEFLDAIGGLLRAPQPRIRFRAVEL